MPDFWTRALAETHEAIHGTDEQEGRPAIHELIGDRDMGDLHEELSGVVSAIELAAVSVQRGEEPFGHTLDTTGQALQATTLGAQGVARLGLSELKPKWIQEADPTEVAAAAELLMLSRDIAEITTDLTEAYVHRVQGPTAPELPGPEA
ncbi:MAG TPA: hypothetical protein VK674_05515 [Candidatus Limnocylindria bacterium]|nr:hypothetical protein [Candidatus Limnocylindria bacterium]